MEPVERGVWKARQDRVSLSHTDANGGMNEREGWRCNICLARCVVREAFFIRPQEKGAARLPPVCVCECVCWRTSTSAEMLAGQDVLCCAMG